MAEMNDNTMRLDGRGEGDDLRMMQTPDLWPQSSAEGAVLPLVRRSGGLRGDAAFIVNKPGIEPTRLFYGLIFDVRAHTLLRDGDPRDLKSELFDSHQAIIKAGWTVD